MCSTLWNGQLFGMARAQAIAVITEFRSAPHPA
jgi:hypothetical protein